MNLIAFISCLKTTSALIFSSSSSHIMSLLVGNYGNNPPPVIANIFDVSKQSIAPIPPLNSFFLNNFILKKLCTLKPLCVPKSNNVFLLLTFICNIFYSIIINSFLR